MNYLKKKDGLALLTVMVIFLVLSILLGALFVLTNNNLEQSQETKEHTTAYYTAEAGLTKAITEFEDYVQALSTQTPALSVTAFMTAVDSYVSGHASEHLTLSDNEGIIPYADITLISNGIQADGYRSYTLTAVGVVGDISRTLVKTYEFLYTISDSGNGFVVDKAVMVKTKFTLTGSSQIVGAPISTYSTADSSISLSWSTKVPAVELPDTLFDASGSLTDTAIFDSLSNINSKITSGGLSAVTPLDEIYEYPAITMPTYPDKNTLARLPVYTIVKNQWESYQLINSSGSINKNSYLTDNVTYSIPSTASWYYVPELIIKGTEYFTIDVGSTDKYLVVDKLQLDGHFVLTGSGTLTIYVTGNTTATATTNESSRISFKYSSSAPVGSVGTPYKFVVYVDPIYQKVNSTTFQPLTVEVGGSSTYYMALMAANLNINITGSGKIYGYVVTGGTAVNISGGSSATITLYYAPNAKVTVSGSGEVNGAVICQEFAGTGNIRVNYRDVAFDNFPFQVLDPITGGSGSSDPVLQIKESSTVEEEGD